MLIIVGWISDPVIQNQPDYYCVANFGFGHTAKLYCQNMQKTAQNVRKLDNIFEFLTTKIINGMFSSFKKLINISVLQFS